MRTSGRLALATLLAGGIVAQAFAAPETLKNAAIDQALAYLASTQAPDGRWIYSGGVEDPASTGAALLAFIEKGHTPGSGTSYSAVVRKGIDYLMSRAQPVAIGPQPAGNPDSDGNGIGVKFVPGGANGRDTYVTGLALPAIAALGNAYKNELVTVGPLAGRVDGSGPGGQWTYGDVVRNTVDYFAWGQNDSGGARGGWRYYANSGDSDNSTAQWPVIGMLFAQNKMGITPPAYVRSELARWIEHIQFRNGTGTGNDGASGYDVASSIPNESKTGGLLVEMYFAQKDVADMPFDLSNPAVLAALSYLNRQWNTSANSTWDGNFGHPYAMWAIYKGLEVMIGLDDTTSITNLLAGACGTQDLGDVCNWFENYNEWLVAHQAPSGSWPGYSSWFGALEAGWYTNILLATAIGPEPTVPAPAALSLFGAAIIGLAALRRRG